MYNIYDKLCKNIYTYIYIYINTRIITLNKFSVGSYLVLRNSRAFQKTIKIGRLRIYFFVKPSGIFLVFIPLEIPDTTKKVDFRCF